MGKAILVTGGARSGKSSYGELLAKNLGGAVLYIATAVPFDEEMRARVKKHRESRPQDWDTYEGYKGLGKVIEEAGNGYNGILLDCVTVMITNILFDFPGLDFDHPDSGLLEKVEEAVKLEMADIMEAIKKTDATVILVTNELGSGIVPENPIARAFRDIAGRANQIAGAYADEVYLTVCGIPMKVK